MSRQQPGVIVAGGLVDEDPAMLAIRLVEESVVAERWDSRTWKDTFVDYTLDHRARLPASFRDNGGTTGDVDAIDPVLPLAHSQRRNLKRLRTRIQLAPGSSGRVVHHVRRALAHGRRRNRGAGADRWTCEVGDDAAVLDREQRRAALQHARAMRDHHHGAAAHQSSD